MESLAEINAALADHVGTLDPAVLSGPQAARLVEQYAALERLAAAGRVLLADRVRTTHAWQGDGHKSCADWMAAKAGTAVHQGHKVLETSRHLPKLGATEAALRRGELSGPQAQVVADAASVDPASEQRLLACARRETFKGLKDEGQRVRMAATDSKARARRIHAKRSITTWVDGEGAGNLRWRGPASDLARLLGVIRPGQEGRFRRSRKTQIHDTYENRTYDAFMDLIALIEGSDTSGSTSAADTAPDGEARSNGQTTISAPHTQPGQDASPGLDESLFADVEVAVTDLLAEADRTPESATPPGPNRAARRRRSKRRGAGGANTKVIVVIDHRALVRGHTASGEVCEIVGLGQVPVADVDAILATSDPFLAAVIQKGHDVVNVAHLGRGVNAFQRTALEATRIHCSNIACNHTLGIQNDHRVPWTVEQITELHNQDRLCTHCHRLKTHHGWHLEPGTGRRRFLPPDKPVGHVPEPLAEDGSSSPPLESAHTS